MVLVDSRRVEDEGDALVLLQRAASPTADLIGSIAGRAVAVTHVTAVLALAVKSQGKKSKLRISTVTRGAVITTGTCGVRLTPRVHVLEMVLHAPKDEENCENPGDDE